MESPPAENTSPTILIVDDTSVTLRVLSDHLEHNGFRVVVATDGREAVERARFAHPDLVLLDVMMPVQDGFETCRQLKSEPELADIPVVFMTSLSETENKLAGFEAGGVDYVVKPLQLAEVTARIRTHVTLRTLQARLAAQNRQLQGEIAQRERAQTALADSHAQLEQHVLERTAELAETNQRLSDEIAERSKIEETLRASEARYRALFEDNPAMYFTLNTEGRVLTVNAFGASQLGYTVEELVGQSVLKVFPPDVHEIVRGHMAQCLDHPGQVHSWEVRKVRKDGSILPVKELARAVPQPTGDPIVLVVCEDTTARVALEAQLRQSQKMEAFGQLAGGVAHDFNNILTVILSASDWASMPGTSTNERLEALGEIRDSARWASNLTRQLLVFSRQHAMNAVPLNLNQIVSDLGRMLARLIGEDVDLRFELSAEAVPVHADAAMLEQVIINLAVNARDAMPEGGSLAIRTSVTVFPPDIALTRPRARPGAFARLEVSDSGCGIPPDVVQRIFEPFYTTKPLGKGSGLGLATSLGIVEQHGGWIDVASTVGEGTRFSVYLPRHTHAVSADAATTKRAPGGTETILLVEDERSVRRATEVILQQAGYRVIVAADASEAIALWQQHRDEIRLLLADILMPGGVSGRSLAGRLVAENPDLRIGFVSGYDPHTIGTRAPEGPTDVAVLGKPFSRDGLLGYVRQRLDAR